MGSVSLLQFEINPQLLHMLNPQTIKRHYKYHHNPIATHQRSTPQTYPTNTVQTPHKTQTPHSTPQAQTHHKRTPQTHQTPQTHNSNTPQTPTNTPQTHHKNTTKTPKQAHAHYSTCCEI
eukprot:Phypoly_transcript_23275.p1 GENE.Phypoly_transcript_23275~~Phypoly_transcript_23275.p1  ORF type:complete len:120 (+),score=28.00 Phypoly_transcript_23275:92-451(+)